MTWTREIAAFFVFLGLGASAFGDAQRNWGQWRGPAMNGVAPHGDPPTTWSEDKNVKWKVDLPGHGHSTPIVWDQLVILQAAVPVNPPKPEAQAAKPPEPEVRPEGERGEGRGGRGGRRERETPKDAYKFTVLALDRATGKTVWERVLREEVPHEGTHEDGSLAPASPVTDGEHIWAFFGSRGLYCLTMKGDRVWEKDFGQMRTRNSFGEGISPALHKDALIINWDHEGDDFIVALDKKTGAEKWRRERDEPTSWSTPIFLEDGQRTQVVVSADNRVTAYDFATGETIWECGGLGGNVTPVPVATENVVIAMSGFRDPAALAIRWREARGDVSDSASVAWRTSEGTSYVPSPLLHGNALYFLQKNTGILSCLDPETGKPHYDQKRLEEITGVYASPVGAADRVYVVGRNGKTQVLRRGPAFESLALNALDDSFSASPAIVGRELFLRGHKRLYCIAEP
jgi:outer membrane protein assembly factor BamB